MDKASIPILNGEAAVLAKSTAEAAKGSTQEHSKDAAGSETNELIECDVLVVGMGFSGISAIHRLRQEGLQVKAFEAADELGGTWHWNRYPGVRVDCEIPLYQLSIPEVYNDYKFAQKFPGGEELRRYIAHIDRTLDLHKDVIFNARVNDASWNSEAACWLVSTAQGHRAKCRYLFLCSGALHRTFTPKFKDMDQFKGLLCHSGSYPQNLSVEGKKVIVVGAGATAVQIIQEVGKKADHLSVLVRRPTMCYPMRQRPLSSEEQNDMKALLPAVFTHSRKTFSGFHDIPPACSTFDVTDAERQAMFEHVWQLGGLHVPSLMFPDNLTDANANRAFYDFWQAKTKLRLTNPHKQQIMCPDEPPYHINTKRPPLEQDYYEVLNQRNVDVVDLRRNAIAAFHPRGLVLADGTRLDADVIILATGFDSFTGSLTSMGLKSKDGVPLAQLWAGADGICMHLGLAIPGFPNLFASYTPLTPAALANGTTMIEAQVETVVAMIAKLERERVRAIEATLPAARQWAADVADAAAATLLPATDSWWNRANVPGARPQQLIYLKGIAAYEQECRAAMDGWRGFEVEYW